MKTNKNAMRHLLRRNWRDIVSDQFIVDDCMRDCFFSDRVNWEILFEYHDELKMTDEEFNADDRGAGSEKRLKKW